MNEDLLRPTLKKLMDDARADALLEAAEFLDARAAESWRSRLERHHILCCAIWMRDLRDAPL